MLATENNFGRKKATRAQNRISRTKARIERATQLLKNSGNRGERSKLLLVRSKRK